MFGVVVSTLNYKPTVPGLIPDWEVSAQLTKVLIFPLGHAKDGSLLWESNEW